MLPSPARAAFAKTASAHHAPDANPEILDEWDGSRMPFADGAFESGLEFQHHDADRKIRKHS